MCGPGQNTFYCGIDPGREKFGVALTDGERLLLSAVVPLDGLDAFIRALVSGEWRGISKWRIEGEEIIGKAGRVFLGSGTGSELFEKKLKDASVSYSSADESMTTMEGRALYWQLHPPRGLWRLVPLSLRVPPRPVDDLAAWAIARRAIEAFVKPTGLTEL